MTGVATDTATDTAVLTAGAESAGNAPDPQVSATPGLPDGGHSAGQRRTRWRCGQHPDKRCYATMRAADHAAQRLRRREADADRVNVFPCGGHLHVGHTRLPSTAPSTADQPPPPPLTWRIHPDQLPAHLTDWSPR